MMEFHPHKCKAVSITHKKSPAIFPYTLHDHTLDHVQVIKYFGVSISNEMRWDGNINNITGKANGTLGSIRRNLNISNIKIKQQAYHSLVHPILEYSSSVWNLYTDTLTNKIKAVQGRAARFILQRYRWTSSVGNMICELDFQSLEERRRVASLKMFFKIHNSLVATEIPNLLTPKQHVKTHTERKLPSIPGTRFDQGLPPNVILPTHGQAVELSPRLHCEMQVTCKLQGSPANRVEGQQGTPLLYQCQGAAPLSRVA